MMKDVATVTKLSPARRVDNVMGFLRRLKQNAEVYFILLKILKK